MKRTIKAVVQRLAETKTAQQYVEDKGLISAANVLFLNSIVPIGPHNAGIQILQGVQQGQRIGNKIRSKSLTIKGTVIPLPFNSSTNAFVYPTQYKMWFFYDKRFPQEVPNPSPDFFQLGGTTAPITGDLSTMWAPVNTDIYKVLAVRTFKCGYSGFNGTGTTVDASGFQNNDFPLNANFSVNLTSKMVKTVVYNDDLSTPTSRTIWMMIVPMAANGGNYNATAIPAKITYVVDYKYTDT